MQQQRVSLTHPGLATPSSLKRATPRLPASLLAPRYSYLLEEASLWASKIVQEQWPENVQVNPAEELPSFKVTVLIRAHKHVIAAGIAPDTIGTVEGAGLPVWDRS
jgi:hypothetical protein